MIHADNAQDLIEKLVSLFETQGQCVEAVKAGYREYRGSRFDRRSKVGAEEVFEAIKGYCQDFREKYRKPPTRYNVSRHIMKRFQISDSRAKTYVGIYVRWRVKGCAQLSEEDHRWMKKNFPAVCKPFIERSKFVEKALAEVRATEREIVREINSRVAAQPRSTAVVRKRKQGKLLTREEIFKFLGLS